MAEQHTQQVKRIKDVCGLCGYGCFWNLELGRKWRTEKGLEDCEIIVRGRKVAIEAKVNKDTQSVDQRARQTAIEGAGGLYLLCKDEAGLRLLERVLRYAAETSMAYWMAFTLTEDKIREWSE